MDLAFELPPESPVAKNRQTRQVAYLWGALARHTRGISRHLRAQATQLRRDSQELEGAVATTRESRPAQSRAPWGRGGAAGAPLRDDDTHADLTLDTTPPRGPGWVGRARTKTARNTQIVRAVLAGATGPQLARGYRLTRERVRQIVNTMARQANPTYYTDLQVVEGTMLVPLHVLTAHAAAFGWPPARRPPPRLPRRAVSVRAARLR
jgi:hypothetical protein